MNESQVVSWAASAPQPTLTVDGHAAVISGVRFVWTVWCGFCRNAVRLWTDGGRIEVGLTVWRARSTGARWFRIHAPAAVPASPGRCPHPGCERFVTDTVNGREVRSMAVDGAWRLKLGPFTCGDRWDDACPLPTVHGDRLVSEVWATLRREYPQMAAEADKAYTRQ